MIVSTSDSILLNLVCSVMITSVLYSQTLITSSPRISGSSEITYSCLLDLVIRVFCIMVMTIR